MHSRIFIVSLLPFLSLLLWLNCSAARAKDANLRADSTQIAQVVMGAQHACALRENGQVLCWGHQLGAFNPIGLLQPLPTPIATLTETIRSLAAGGFHTCAVTDQARVKCWGWNNYGVLGGDSTPAQPIVEVTNLSEDVRMAALGNLHSCVLTIGNGVKCWGYNRSGELGDGSHENKYEPSDVIGLNTGVSMIDAGGYHTCALTTSQEVYCWGENQYGQLGDGSITISRTTPVKVAGLSAVTAISVGGEHSCALVSNQVKCWGSNHHGELGDNTTVLSSSVPVDVVGLSDVREVAAYASHTCALLTSGVHSWGNNRYGRLGDGTQHSSNTPVAVTGLGGAVAALGQGGAFNIFTREYGGDFTCVIVANGDVQCWGNNLNGQLGDGTGGERIGGAVPVVGLQGKIVAIAAGGLHTCALNQARLVYCWGNNESGQLGNGTLIDSATPVTVTGLSGETSAIAAGDQYTCAVSDAGAAQCWGSNMRGVLGIETTVTSSTLPVNVAGLSSGVRVIAPGALSSWRYIGNTATHTCAVLNTGVVNCWGGNYQGELGDGTTTDRWQPLAVAGLAAIPTSVTTGYGFSCALLADGSVKCWGGNLDGVLGDGTFTASKTPVQVSGLTNAKTLVTGSDHSCAISNDGQVNCWGVNNPDGQLGDGTTTNRGIPTAVIGLPGKVTALAAGDLHSCAVLEEDAVYCWGSNNYRQLGTIFQGLSSPTPVMAQRFASPPLQISSRGHHTCALLQNGQVQCWGANTYGQLGNEGAWRIIPRHVLLQRYYLPIIFP